LKKQIVSLGAGSDTRFWRLASGPLKERVVAYVEVDFPENTGRKAQIIWDTPGLRSVLNEEAKNGNALTSSVYHLRPLDLREPPERSLTQVMQDCGLSRDLPTLFLAECVFVYMNPSASDAVIRWFGDSFDIVGGIIYEMFGLNDSFGKVMKKNLKARHISLPGADAYPTLPSQESRFKNQSFTNAHAISLKTLRQLHIPDKEFSRESRFEFLDEVEELELVLDHYVVAWGSNDPPDSQLAVEWGFQPSN
jgi:[phosphatase 2A protein]-leucine-carboxy methyltransferase